MTKFEMFLLCEVWLLRQYSYPKQKKDELRERIVYYFENYHYSFESFRTYIIRQYLMLDDTGIYIGLLRYIENIVKMFDKC